MSDQVRVLVLAPGMAESDELLEALRSRAAERPVAFTLVIAAVPKGLSQVGGPDPDETEQEQEDAEQNLQTALERLRGAGLEVEGRVGDPDPVAAAEDAVNFEEYDEILVATPPTRVMRWLKVDLAKRVEGATGRSVTHIQAS